MVQMHLVLLWSGVGVFSLDVYDDLHAYAFALPPDAPVLFARQYEAGSGCLARQTCL